MRRLKVRHPQLLVDPDVYADDERIFQAMCAGACGYLLKKTPPERIIECLREVVAGAWRDCLGFRGPPSVKGHPA